MPATKRGDDWGRSAQLNTSLVSATGGAATIGISGSSLETTPTRCLVLLLGGKNEYPVAFSIIETCEDLLGLSVGKLVTSLLEGISRARFRFSEYEKTELEESSEFKLEFGVIMFIRWFLGVDYNNFV
jgi:hypothetical protein